MQEFFKTTIISKFIKYLLMVTPLPNVSYLNDYDIMVEDNFYLYHGKIYKCTRTGIFNGSNVVYKDYLYCSETVYCGDNLRCTDGLIEYGGKRIAQYEVVDNYVEGKDIIGMTEYFHSTRTYYDEQTHIKLGDYLRLLRSMYGLDLMSLYNCYCNYYVDNIDISRGRLYEDNNPQYKVTLIPIKFNRTYTLAMNCSSTIFIKPVIYDGRLIKNSDNKTFVYDNRYTNITKLSGCSSSNPVKISVSNTDAYAQSLEKYLYLAIQVPVTNMSSITILEGDFNNYFNKMDYDARLFKYAVEKDINKTFITTPSLLAIQKRTIQLNGRSLLLFNSEDEQQKIDNMSIPFSDRLIEYLVGHTIDMRDEISENITRVTNEFGYKVGYEGSWDVSIRGKLFDMYTALQEKKADILNFEDILGYVDKDIEEALNRGYLKYVGDA